VTEIYQESGWDALRTHQHCHAHHIVFYSLGSVEDTGKIYLLKTVSGEEDGMVIALAGRRVDALGAAPPRFPAANVTAVRARIRVLLREQQALALVCSAACGVDLLALEAAAGLGIRRRIVLPYTRGRFRDTSVVDRGGDWGARFDAMVDAAEASGDLIVLGYAEGAETTYLATNTAILEQAAWLAEQWHHPVGAAVVWDGTARGEDDVTAAFLREAQHRGFPVWHVATLLASSE
jgi:hypothetical protein